MCFLNGNDRKIQCMLQKSARKAATKWMFQSILKLSQLSGFIEDDMTEYSSSETQNC